jgi:hypothetical protein
MRLSAPELLATGHDVSAFACGKPALDHWLKTRALSNQEKGFTIIMAVHDGVRFIIAPPRRFRGSASARTPDEPRDQREGQS